MNLIMQAANDQGLSDSETALFVAAIAGLTTVLVAVLGAWITAARARSDRRREVYSKATRSALAWTEFLYRVRRRQEGKEHELVGKFHDAQEELAFYRAWIGSDSIFVQRSFAKLVTKVKSVAEPLIEAAWKEDVRDAPGDARPEDEHSSVDIALEDFLRDVRSHLSLWPWRWLAVAWRNRKSK